MKKSIAARFLVFSSLFYFLAFLLPYFAGSGFFFYFADFFQRFVILLVPVGTAALLLPRAYEEKPRHLLLFSFLFSLPITAYTLLSGYLDVFAYGFSTGGALLISLCLSVLYAFFVGLLVFLALLLLRFLLSRVKKEDADGGSAFDFGKKVPFSVGVINAVYTLGTLLYEIVSAAIFLCRYFDSYSLSEILYIGCVIPLIFAFFFPVQKIAVRIARGAENARKS